MAVKFQFRRDTAANWESNNPILSEGEFGLDLTNQRFKIGDGVNTWNNIDSAQYTNKAETFSETLTVSTGDWVEQTTGDWDGVFIATKTVTGIISNDTPFVDLDLSGLTAANFAPVQNAFINVFRVEVSANNEMKFYSSSLPVYNFPLQIKVVR